MVQALFASVLSKADDVYSGAIVQASCQSNHEADVTGPQ